MANENGQGGGFLAFFQGLLLGGLIGAAIAILKAPQSGDETRALLRARTDEARNELEQSILEARLRAQEIIGDVRARAEEIQTQTQDTFNEQRQRLEAAAEAGRKAYDEGKEKKS
ncbi:MAG: YtxH domain-containing protein [Anaerolineales bacterium]